MSKQGGGLLVKAKGLKNISFYLLPIPSKRWDDCPSWCYTPLMYLLGEIKRLKRIAIQHT